MYRKLQNQINKLNSVVASISSIERALAEPDKATGSLGSTSYKDESSTFIQLLARQEHYMNGRRLSSFARSYFSPADEDGIIAEIFQRIKAGKKIFVELGSGDGRKNNTLYLLLQNWQGFWVEENAQAVMSSHQLWHKYLSDNALQVARAKLCPDTVADIFADLAISNMPDMPDFLSVNLGANSFYVLASCLEIIRPRVICIKYDPTLGPAACLCPPYDSTTEASGNASLKAIELLGRKYEYSLVACSLQGNTAFLVHNDFVEDMFAEPFSSENHFEPFWPKGGSLVSEDHLEKIATFENPFAEPNESGKGTAIYAATDKSNFFVSPQDKVVGWNILNRAEWEPFISDLIAQNLRAGDLVLDIGANIGWHAIWSGKQVGSQGHVIAFEPVPTNFELLNRNVKAADCLPQISTFNVALSDKVGSIAMELSDTNFGDHRIRLDEGKAGTKTVSVRSTTLDEFYETELPPELRDKPIQLIKIDTQGAEVHIFKMGQNVLAKTQVLISEYWPYGLRRLGSEVAEFWEHVEKHFSKGAVVAYKGEPMALPYKILPIMELKAQLLADKDYSQSVEYDIVLYK